MSTTTPFSSDSERADEARALHSGQTLPLHSDGSLNIAGFRLRDADHRRLAVELICDIVTTVLPAAETVVALRREAQSPLSESQNTSFTGAAAGGGSFGTTPPAGAGDREEGATEHIRTRTRTVKLSSVDQHASSVENAAIHLRPFVTQLLLYPDCADDIGASLIDIFVAFVNASATAGDASCVVQTFVRWLSALCLRYDVDRSLAGCGIVLDLQRCALTIAGTAVIRPVELAQCISRDVFDHLEDESCWYPAARVCLARLYLATAAANNGGGGGAAVAGTGGVAGVAGGGGDGSGTPAELGKSASVCFTGNGSDDDGWEIHATRVLQMVQSDTCLAVRKAALGELAQWLRDTPVHCDLAAKAKLCVTTLVAVENESRRLAASVASTSSPTSATSSLSIHSSDDALAADVWAQADSFRYSCIPLVLAACDALRTSGSRTNSPTSSSQSPLQQASDFALRLAADASWRVRFQVARVISELAALPCRDVADSARWVDAAATLARDEEPAVRAAVAARVTDVFLDASTMKANSRHDAIADSNDGGGGVQPLLSGSRDDASLAVILALARDREAPVRCAVVRCFFDAWRQLDSRVGAARRDECFAALLALLGDDKVRVIAIESLASLGALLERAAVLDAVVHAIVSAVPDESPVTNASTSRSASLAGNWHVRLLAAQQLPHLANYISAADFTSPSLRLWSCLHRLLVDPTAAVRDYVAERCLPRIAGHYGAVLALRVVREWLEPLVRDAASFQRRRCGLVAVAHLFVSSELGEMWDETTQSPRNASGLVADASKHSSALRAAWRAVGRADGGGDGDGGAAADGVGTWRGAGSASADDEIANEAALRELREIARGIFLHALRDPVALVREVAQKVLEGSDRVAQLVGETPL